MLPAATSGAATYGRILEQLYCAARDGDVAVVQRLLEQDVPPDLYQHAGGDTALGVAAVAECSLAASADIAKMLVEKGANVNHTDRNGATALHGAAGAGKADVVNVLLAAQATTTHNKQF